MRSRRSPSFPSGLAKKKKETPSTAASGGQRRRRRLGDGFLGAPGSCSRRPVGARAGAARDPGRARGAPRGQYGRIPRNRESERVGPCACGAGEGSGGPLGNRGARGSGSPGKRPLLAGDPARRPGSASERRERMRSGTLLFCRPRIVGSSGQSGHICRRRHHCRGGLGPPKSQRGGGPGRAGRRARAGAELAGHFLCPAALPPAPLPPHAPPPPPPPPPRTRPARPPPPPWPHFSGGANQKEKVSQEGLARARPGRRGLGAAQRQPGGRYRLFLLVLRGAGRTRAAEGKRLSFSTSRSSQRPGASWAEARGWRGVQGLSPAGGPRRGRSPAAHAAPRCREAAGRGALRGHRRPRRDTHAHTLPSVARFPPPRMVTDTESACARECVWCAQPPNTFSGGGPSSSWLQGHPGLVFYKGKEEFFVEIPA